MASKDKDKKNAYRKYQREYHREYNKKTGYGRRKSAEYRAKYPDKVKQSKNKYYYDNQTQIIKNAKTNYNKWKAFRQKVKLAYGCCNPYCQWQGHFHPEMLDFHHLDPTTKKRNIGHIANQTLIDEINKCTVLCRNCHSEATFRGLDTSKFKRCQINMDGDILNIMAE